MESPTAVQRYRPVDLAREHGISTQAVRNYERDGFLPPAARTPSGYRAYTTAHVLALRAHLALVAAHGYATAGEGHARGPLRRPRRRPHRDRPQPPTATPRPRDPRRRRGGRRCPRRGAHRGRPGPPAGDRAPRPPPRRLPATLRKWERAGVLTPRRDPRTGQRQYDAADVRDAQLAHLLRRGGYLLGHIATVVRQVRSAGGAEPLAASLHDWRKRLTTRGLLALTAAARLTDYLHNASATGT